MVLKKKIDLHMHSAVSDGSNPPEEIISCVKNAGIGLFALSDHDAVKGCGIIRSLLQEGDPAFINGVEFSCRDKQGRYHILGYGYNPDSEAITALVDKGHSLRMYKVTARLEFVQKEFGFTFPEEEIKELLSMDNPGKPHIGNLMVKHGYAQSREDAIKNYIDKLHVGSKYLSPEEVIPGILAGGGIPVLAHPYFGDGDQLILGKEMEDRLERLMEFGLKGVEAFYSGFSPKLVGEMIDLADRHQLYVTAGSDYHGTNKLEMLGDTGMEENSELVPGMVRFLETVHIYTKDKGASFPKDLCRPELT